jgi:hypothetical protein
MEDEIKIAVAIDFSEKRKTSTTDTFPLAIVDNPILTCFN